MFNHSVMSHSLQLHGLHTPGFPILHRLPEFAQTHIHWVSDAIQPSHPLSSPLTSPEDVITLCHLPSIFPSIRVFSNELALHISWSKYWTFSFSISPSNEHPGLISFRIWLIWSCSPRDCQESSPAPQFKSINLWALSFSYGPTLTSLYDYWKTYSFDSTDLCWQSDVSAFQYAL